MGKEVDSPKVIGIVIEAQQNGFVLRWREPEKASNEVFLTLTGLLRHVSERTMKSFEHYPFERNGLEGEVYESFSSAKPFTGLFEVMKPATSEYMNWLEKVERLLVVEHGISQAAVVQYYRNNEKARSDLVTYFSGNASPMVTAANEAFVIRQCPDEDE
jgi:hypothetical protein